MLEKSGIFGISIFVGIPSSKFLYSRICLSKPSIFSRCSDNSSIFNIRASKLLSSNLDKVAICDGPLIPAGLNFIVCS